MIKNIWENAGAYPNTNKPMLVLYKNGDVKIFVFDGTVGWETNNEKSDIEKYAYLDDVFGVIKEHEELYNVLEKFFPPISDDGGEPWFRPFND